ncbi:MAG: 6-hydroxymethylpterin diphosphokinase MptE-like protein [Chloroflexota bacterium]|nr:6-hydroxymethylpterin diphosphokinase MptE-like protein [Chloroflexota bacterium]
MTTIKQTIKNITPPSVWNTLRHNYRVWLWGTVWHWNRRGRPSVQRLRALKDKHKGQRCFIIGNGPSLKQMNLSPLRNEYTFGLNRIYLLFPEIGFTTTYYVSINPYVIEQCAAEIAALSMPKFLAWRARDFVNFDQNTVFIPSYPLGLRFSTNPSRCIWEGGTVTYATMQLAYHMGFEQVILIGVDHSFVTQGPPGELVVSQSDDPDHFSGDYFGRGFYWQLPDLETSEKAYRLARDTYRRDAREILDATVGGRLQVFPKTAYESLFCHPECERGCSRSPHAG